MKVPNFSQNTLAAQLNASTVINAIDHSLLTDLKTGARVTDLTHTAVDPSIESGPVIVLSTPPNQAPRLSLVQLKRRMAILYVTDPAAANILGKASDTGMRGLPWLFRQEPSGSQDAAALTGDGTQRMSKISGTALAKASTPGMTTMLRSAVDKTCTTPRGISTCAAHMVAVDEIGAAFGSIPGSAQPGAGTKLVDAMSQLETMPSRWGGTYASRIHFYVAPGVSTAISAGRGARRTLGADGKVHFRDYSAVTSALAKAGGVWLEMYHYPEHGGPRTPFTAEEWRDVPTDMASFLLQKSVAKRNPVDYLHFVLTETAGSDLASSRVCTITPSGSQAPNSNIVIRPGEAAAILNTLPGCKAPVPICVSLAAPAGGSESEITQPGRQRGMVGVTPPGNIFLTGYRTALIIKAPAEFAVVQPTPSGMMCQWQRAQTGSMNARILANGPAAFKVTGTEAEVFSTQFRQFFLVR